MNSSGYERHRPCFTETLSSIQRLALAGEMAAKLAQDNPRFSAERFVAAVVDPDPEDPRPTPIHRRDKGAPWA